MKTFIVQTEWTGTSCYIVKADTEEQAKEKFQLGEFEDMLIEGGMYNNEEVTSCLEETKFENPK